ncbi:MAG TPA: hypothetical protein VGA94_01485 [Thermodesulfobacteriota bacterium]
MMYLTIIFISPLYFLIRQKWGGFILNVILYLFAWLGLMTVVFFWIGIPFWILAVGHAGWHLRQELMEKHAELVATKMAEKMKEGNTGKKN